MKSANKVSLLILMCSIIKTRLPDDLTDHCPIYVQSMNKRSPFLNIVIIMCISNATLIIVSYTSVPFAYSAH